MMIKIRMLMLAFLFSLLPFTNMALAEEVFEFESCQELLLQSDKDGYYCHGSTRKNTEE
jgi:hypothetical protein